MPSGACRAQNSKPNSSSDQQRQHQEQPTLKRCQCHVRGAALHNTEKVRNRVDAAQSHVEACEQAVKSKSDAVEHAARHIQTAGVPTTAESCRVEVLDVFLDRLNKKPNDRPKECTSSVEFAEAALRFLEGECPKAMRTSVELFQAMYHHINRADVAPYLTHVQTVLRDAKDDLDRAKGDLDRAKAAFNRAQDLAKADWRDALVALDLARVELDKEKDAEAKLQEAATNQLLAVMFDGTSGSSETYKEEVVEQLSCHFDTKACWACGRATDDVTSAEIIPRGNPAFAHGYGVDVDSVCNFVLLCGRKRDESGCNHLFDTKQGAFIAVQQPDDAAQSSSAASEGTVRKWIWFDAGGDARKVRLPSNPHRMLMHARARAVLNRMTEEATTLLCRNVRAVCGPTQPDARSIATWIDSIILPITPPGRRHRHDKRGRDAAMTGAIGAAFSSSSAWVPPQ